jgi:D-glycero-alpha-D-manno-heptose 1-phosphate guanylyltransferase
MATKEAIILAGGLGTRLREAVPDVPKCMAPVAGRPFLFYVINYLRSQGIEKFIFSLGYRHEVIEQYLAEQFATLQYDCVVEEEPLGTGGAIQLACQKVTDKSVVVTNGDTLFKANIRQLSFFQQQQGAICTLGLKPMKNVDRYGAVEVNKEDVITAFKEKQFYQNGLINGGVYVLNVAGFLANNFPAKFSFENDFLEKQTEKGTLTGIVQNSYFIDIGIPEDYTRAQEEFKRIPLDLAMVTKKWTLFLDRDGVINEDKEGSYIFGPEEFIFTLGGAAIFKKLTAKFNRIIIVTNQRGVGKGLMKEKALDAIHQKMQTAINAAGGKIDAVYYATSIHNNDILRKPNPGMALKAKKDFPDIDLTHSIMIGNNISDMQFGRNAGMYTVFVTSTNKNVQLPHPDIDLIFDTLSDFVKAL